MPRAALLEALAARAFTPALPTGFDADAVLTREGRHSRLNVRSAAIVPISAIARWAATAADAGEGSTPERLRAAADAGVLRGDQAQTLTEAFELALELRIVHQLDQIAAGQAPDDLLDAAAMSALTRGAPARRVPRGEHRGPGAAAGVRLSLKRGDAGSRSAQLDGVDRDTPWRQAEWCAIDLELTGLHRSDEIIAIGAVPIRDGALILGEAMYTLARPEHPPKHASVLVHKLRSVDLREAPPLDDAIDRLLETLNGSRARVPHRDGRARLPGQGAAPAAPAAPRRRRHRGAGPAVAAPARRRHARRASRWHGWRRCWVSPARTPTTPSATR